MKTYLRFLRNALRYKSRLVISLIAVIGVNIFQFASLSAVVPFLDNIITNEPMVLPDSVYQILPTVITEKLNFIVAFVNNIDQKDKLFYIPIFLFLAVVLRAFFEFVMKLAMESVSQGVMRDFMTQLYDHLQKLPVQYFSKHRTGELISRVTSDVNIVQAGMSARFTDNIAQIVQIPVLLGTAFILNWKLTLIAGISLPLLMGPIIIIGNRIRKLSRKTQEKIADIYSFLQETIVGVRIVRAFNMEEYESARFLSQANKYYRLRIKTIIRTALVSPMTEIVGVLCLLLVAYYLVSSVLSGELSFGFVGMYCGALLISIKPFRSIGKVNNVVQRAMGALGRIYDLLDTEPSIKEIPGAIEMPLLKDKIVFDSVGFYYDENEPPILNDVNLTVSCGEMIAIVGSSGAGKTTFVNLIPRFYDVTEGRILFDGMNIRDATFSSLREQIGIVTQETFLFNDTVRNNIAYGRTDILQEKVEQAARAANAHDFIMELPQGYDTVIGELGTRLSGGQKQRLAIARAILKNPRVLILDEATSALDTESEKLVQEAIDRLVEDRTVFAIAHRLSTIRHADKILVLEGGRIAQIGTHEDLIEDAEGLYRKLHDMQQWNDEPEDKSSSILDIFRRGHRKK